MQQLISLTDNNWKLSLLISLVTLWGCGNADSNTESNVTPAKTAERNNSQPLGGTSASEGSASDSFPKQIKTKIDQLATEPIPGLSLTETPIAVAFDETVLKAFQKLSTPIESFEEWEIANQALLSLGEPAIPLLAHKLLEGDHVERELAASTLASMGQTAAGAINALEKSLTDELPFVRANAAVALVQFPEQQQLAIPVLVEFLEHSDQNLQTIAAMNLISLGEEASPHVAKLTHLLAKKTAEPQVLLPVVQLLGRIGPKAESALPQLKQIAFEQQGDVGAAATSAIQLIQTTDQATPFPAN